MGLRERTEQSEVRPVNGKAETNDREAGEDSDEDTQDEEEYFFVEDALDRRKKSAGGLHSRHGRRRRRRGRINEWRGITH